MIYVIYISYLNYMSYLNYINYVNYIFKLYEIRIYLKLLKNDLNCFEYNILILKFIF